MRLPSPEGLEGPAMPSEDGFRLDEDQAGPPVPRDPRKEDPENTIGWLELWALDAPLKNEEMMSEGEDLEEELGTFLCEGSKEARRKRKKDIGGFPSERCRFLQLKIGKYALRL